MADIKISQTALEAAQTAEVAGDIRATQDVVEAARSNEAAAELRGTQDALETVAFPPNEVWASQVCLEVLFPAYTPPTPASRRNHSFVGVWMGTGHADNASFSY